jgi:hypothetical protein
LRSAGIETRVFGQPMAFWREHMPSGMLLRSSRDASHIDSPEGSLSLDKYEKEAGVSVRPPIRLDAFLRYGQWFQEQAAPDVDPRKVVSVEPAYKGFRVLLEDDEVLHATRVVIATGLSSFNWYPPQFVDVPRLFVSHTSEHADFKHFTQRRVLVVGGGQSAFESAALLYEAGASVEVVVRSPRVRWLRRSEWLHNRLWPLLRFIYPSTDVGPLGLSWIIALPQLFRRLPIGAQQRIAARSIRPAVAASLRPRLAGIPITTGREVLNLDIRGHDLRVVLSDGSERHVDHVLLGTGYRVQVERCAFLGPDLLARLRRVAGYPCLQKGLESTVPGLHFLGAAAANSFGPVLRFVSGTRFASRALTACIVGSVPSRNGGKSG